MPRHLTPVEKACVLMRLEDGWSIQRVAAHLNVNKSTIFKIKKRYEEKALLTRKVGSGKVKISSPEED